MRARLKTFATSALLLAAIGCRLEEASLVGAAGPYGGLASQTGANGNPQNPILFVTQVPMPEEVNWRDVLISDMSCVSPFSNHLADTRHAGRGGSLHERFPDGTLVDLLAIADWGAAGGARPAPQTIAVRNPAVHPSATRALFSMVVGAPSGPDDPTAFRWQLYEITLPTQAELAVGVRPVLTLVSNQPAANNVFPTYAPGGRVVFASDRPYNGQAHLTQREEYLGIPTVSGLWSLDPADAASLLLLHHAPSGVSQPSVDAAGRVVFTSWDHLSRDPEAVTDSRPPVTAAPYSETFTQTFNGSGNFADEGAGATFTPITAMAPNSWDLFPEPRSFDRKLLIDGYAGNLNGNSFNIFLPWTVNPDGTAPEVLNHAGRHELAAGATKSFKNDADLVDLLARVAPGYGGMTARSYFNNLLATREDPLRPGSYVGIDAQDLGTHGAGQIVRVDNAGVGADGRPQNPDGARVVYLTAGATASKPPFIPNVRPSGNLPPTGQQPLGTPETLYRTALPCSDGSLVASVATGVRQSDYNIGTAAQPASQFTFRLSGMVSAGAAYVPGVALTPGININTSYYVGATQVSYNGPAWELDPAEVAPRAMPPAASATVDPIEAAVFATEGVHLPTFQAWLRSIGAALAVSRNVTRRDMHDRQQPFNLKVAWSSTQTTGTAGKLYNVAWQQFLQADLRRGYAPGGGPLLPGRRVVATPLHDTMAENVAAAGAPPGSVRIADDGSTAAILPARKAMTWQLLDNDAAFTSQVKERFWVTFQPGEVRTCAACHGVNTADQRGTAVTPLGPPSNAPQALSALLRQWKSQHPAGAAQFSTAALTTPAGATVATLTVTRTGGGTGPLSVAYATADGTAHAGSEYAATSGTLTWADGDSTPRTIVVTIAAGCGTLNGRAFTVSLSTPQYGAVGTPGAVTVTLTGT